MTYQEFSPDPPLQEHIKCFWMLERDFQLINGCLDVLPDSYIEVIFNVGSRCWIDDGKATRELPPFYLVTLFEKPFRLHTRGKLRTIGIRFYAWGFYPLLGINIPTDTSIHVLDERWHRLHDCLLHAEDRQIGATIQSNLLNQFMSNAAFPTPISPGLTAWRGDLNVTELATQCHFSPRQMERHFRTQARITPKALARRLRFESARDALSQNPSCDLAQLAIECGYADQAHLSREFKYFSNRSPRQFIAEICHVEVALRFGVGFFQP